MSVADGQRVSASVTNAAFMSRTVDTSTSGKVDLSNAAAESGSSITNTQRELNALNSFIGKTVNQVFNHTPTWDSDVIGSVNDPIKDRVDAIQTVVESLSGSGGGGGSVAWIEDVNAPSTALENHIRVYMYDAADTQNLYALIKVPEGYVAGGQIEMISYFYSADTSGNALMTTQSTLIRAGVDAMSSTTNQYTSTNAAVTLSGATASIPQAVTFDLTSSIGEVNSVGVSPGDLLIVKLYRGTDTATGQVKIPVYGAEFSF